MPRLPAPWALLATCSGRIDPWPLIERLGGPDGVTRARPADLLAVGAPLDLAARAARFGEVESPQAFVLAGGPGYPGALRSLPFAPPVLFVEGRREALDPPALAIVGTRRCTAEGRRLAADLADAVCLAGAVVISGMAIGIDTAAHLGALRSGRTVAVLGQGLAVPMSVGAARLRAQILGAGGAVLSELLPSHPARGFTFLSRNRIIAGLAAATVVVEASHRSGALATARHAIEAGREVLAVPWSYTHGTGAGCLDLIERGQAAIVRGPETVLRAAGLDSGARCPSAEGAVQEHALLIEALDRGASLEQVAGRGDLSLAQALALLAELEALGLVRRLPGQRFERVRSR